MKQQYNLSEDTKWIAIGGSYAGALAAWMRFKYPHLVYGAVSSSGPLLAKMDYKGLLDMELLEREYFDLDHSFQFIFKIIKIIGSSFPKVNSLQSSLFLE